MQVVLVMFLADGERRDFPVTKTVTTIGRKPSCNFRIPVPTVSREHCRVELRKDGVYVRDLGSSNGTYVNHTQVQEKRLKPGDTLTIGPVNFILTVDGKPESLNPVPTDVGTKASAGLDDAAAGAAASASAVSLLEDQESIEQAIGLDEGEEGGEAPTSPEDPTNETHDEADELLQAMARDEKVQAADLEGHEPTNEELDNMTLDDLDSEDAPAAVEVSIEESTEYESPFDTKKAGDEDLGDLATSALDNLEGDASDEEAVDILEVEEEFADPLAQSSEPTDVDEEVDLDSELESAEQELPLDEEEPQSDLEAMVKQEPQEEDARDETDAFAAMTGEKEPGDAETSAEELTTLSEPQEAEVAEESFSIEEETLGVSAEPSESGENGADEEDPFASLLSEESEGDNDDLSALADLLNEDDDEK